MICYHHCACLVFFIAKNLVKTFHRRIYLLELLIFTALQIIGAPLQPFQAFSIETCRSHAHLFQKTISRGAFDSRRNCVNTPPCRGHVWHQSYADQTDTPHNGTNTVGTLYSPPYEVPENRCRKEKRHASLNYLAQQAVHDFA